MPTALFPFKTYSKPIIKISIFFNHKERFPAFELFYVIIAKTSLKHQLELLINKQQPQWSQGVSGLGSNTTMPEQSVRSAASSTVETNALFHQVQLHRELLLLIGASYL